MIALLSRWKLKNGCPPEFASALENLASAVRDREPGTLVYAIHLPAPCPPIGPPPDYAVSDDPEVVGSVDRNELVFFEVYRDAGAFSEHLRGAVRDFMRENRHYFHTPWQGHPRPQVVYLEPQSLLVRSSLTAEVATPR
jgi:quinol monooxygenase YgiN